MSFDQLTSIVYLTLGILILLLGILIIRENPNRRLNRVTGIMMFLASLAPIMGAFNMLVTTASTEIPVNITLFQRIYLIWEFFFPELLVFALIFPRENSLIRNHPRMVPLLFIPHTVQLIIVLLFDSSEKILNLINLPEGNAGIILQPFFIVFNLMLSSLSYLHRYHSNVFAVINIIFVFLAIYIMYRGYIQLKAPRLRQQVGIVLWGIRVSVGLYVITFLLPKLFPIQVTQKLNYSLTLLALIIGPGSIALSIIKYQFLDIRLIIRRGIIFSMTSGLLVGIYLFFYGQTKVIFTDVLGIDIPIIEIVFLILAVIFFQPILSSIEDLVEKIFVHDKSDYRNVLKRLSYDILHIIEIDELKHKVIQTLSESMMLTNVKLILRNDEGIFCVEGQTDDVHNPVKFSPKSEFISLMNFMGDYIGLEDLISRIQHEREIKLIRSLDVVLFIPFSHHNVLTGILCLGKKLTKTRFSAEDLMLLRVLSDQIAVALENAELMKEKLEKQRIDEEISVTREIQKMLLPHEIPVGENFELSAINLPSRIVGGDYYDFCVIQDRYVGIAIGDISGKGIPGAILMSNLQASFRAVSEHNLSSAATTAKINSLISRTTSSEKFATFFYGILDTKLLSFNYTNAGHNYPIILKANGECQFIQGSDLIVGVHPEYAYNESTLQLNPGDFLVFYTDGITEALNPSEVEFSEGKLLEYICKSNVITAEDMRDSVYNEVIDFTQGKAQHDDITLIVLKITKH